MNENWYTNSELFFWISPKSYKYVETQCLQQFSIYDHRFISIQLNTPNTNVQKTVDYVYVIYDLILTDNSEIKTIFLVYLKKLLSFTGFVQYTMGWNLYTMNWKYYEKNVVVFYGRTTTFSWRSEEPTKSQSGYHASRLRIEHE